MLAKEDLMRSLQGQVKVVIVIFAHTRTSQQERC